MRIKEVTYGEQRRLPFDVKTKTYPWAKLSITAELTETESKKMVIDELRFAVQTELGHLPETIPTTTTSDKLTFWELQDLFTKWEKIWNTPEGDKIYDIIEKIIEDLRSGKR